MDNLKLDNLKLDILTIKNKIAECKTNNKAPTTINIILITINITTILITGFAINI